jgi:hypothetical protein
MAPVAIAAAVAATGQMISGISQYNNLRSQAKAKKIAGRQQLAQETKARRHRFGKQAVEAFSTGLTGSSFSGIMDVQANEDALALGQLSQRNKFAVKSLKRQATGALVGSAFKAGATLAGGFAGAPPAKTGQSPEFDIIEPKEPLIGSSSRATSSRGKPLLRGGR